MMRAIKLEYRITKQGFLEPAIEVSNAELQIGKYGNMVMEYLKNEIEFS